MTRLATIIHIADPSQRRLDKQTVEGVTLCGKLLKEVAFLWDEPAERKPYICRDCMAGESDEKNEKPFMVF